MAYLLAVAAALSNAITTILQRMGVETAPAESTMRLSLLTHALRRKVWLAGFAMLIAGFLLQFSALHFGGLVEVQPVLTLELPFLVAILGLWFRHPLSWRDWAGSIAAAGGLAAFLLFANPGGGTEMPGLSDWSVVSAASVGAAALAVVLTRWGSAAWRASMFGVSAAIAFAFTAGIIKQMNLQISHSWSTLFLHWSPYALAASGLAGMFLAQNAFHAGPVTASQATLVIVDPLASIAIGIGLFGDRVMTDGVRGPGEAVALLVLFAGVFSLSRSPLVSVVKSEDGEELHVLSRRRPKKQAAAVGPG
jgi:drug/metabolite transporter (DMT)-like permease